MNRLMIRVSAMELPEHVFEERTRKFQEYITDGEATDICLAISENRKLDGKKCHLHCHIYIETTYSVENIRKILKEKIFHEDYFRHVKGKGHKPIVIQKALKDKEMCFKYLLKLNPPKIISKYKVEDEQINLLKGLWQDISKDTTNQNYLQYMAREISETEYAQLSDPLSRKGKKIEYIDKVVYLTVEFFVNVIEKPFATDLVEKYTRLWLCKTVKDYKMEVNNRVSQVFYEEFGCIKH